MTISSSFESLIINRNPRDGASRMVVDTGQAVARWTGAVFEAVRRRVATWSAERRLASYDDVFLKDIGIARSGIGDAVRYGRPGRARLMR